MKRKPKRITSATVYEDQEIVNLWHVDINLNTGCIRREFETEEEAYRFLSRYDSPYSTPINEQMVNGHWTGAL